MIERMLIVDILLRCRINFFLKSTRADANHSGHRNQMRGEVAFSKTYSKMSKHAGKRKQRYLYHPRDWLKLTHIIHGPRNSSDEWKLLNDFGYKYTKVITSK